ncbi:hypothetical protein CKO23_22420 [Thiocystis violacea]|nr:hypothetical protein [Thiocystis violacea]
MASIERTAYPRFPHALSDQELDARFGPTDEETVLTVEASLGASARLTFLVLLKTRQQLGYFPVLDEVPESIVAFLRAALGLPGDTVLLDARVKTHTLSRYRGLIRGHLGVHRYGDGGEALITPVIRAAALTMSDPADLINLAIETLVKANVELPAFSALDRVVGHLRQDVHAALYQSITSALSREQRAILVRSSRCRRGRVSHPWRGSRSRRDRRPCSTCASGPSAWRSWMRSSIPNPSSRESHTPRFGSSPPRPIRRRSATCAI